MNKKSQEQMVHFESKKEHAYTKKCIAKELEIHADI